MKKRPPILLDDSQLEELRGIIEKYKPRYGHFEKNNFFPELIGRLEHTLSLCVKMKQVSDDPNSAKKMALVFEKLVSEGFTHFVPTQEVEAKKYFDSVSLQLDRDFIVPIRALIQEFNTKKNDYTAENINALMNKTRNLFQIFIGLKDQLFHYSLGTFFSAKREDGQIIVKPPAEIDIIAMPFKVAVDEIENVAHKTNESIKLWIDDIRKSREQFLDLVIKSAETQKANIELAAAQKNFWVQFMIASTAMLLIALGYFGNLLLENRALSKGLDQIQAELSSCRERTKVLPTK